MDEQKLIEINWTAAFIGFSVDWAFSLLVGSLVMAIMIAIKGGGLESDDALPADVSLATQSVGIVGALVGGIVAGYVARQRGSLHGILGSLIGLPVGICVFGFSPDIGDMGFIVLNLVGAGYGGGIGERWRRRREKTD